MNMMNRNGMQGPMLGNPMGQQQPAQGGFQPYQTQLSPMPRQQPGQLPQQQQPHMNMGGVQPGMAVSQAQQQQAIGGRFRATNQLGPADEAAVNDLTQRLMAAAPDAEKEHLRGQLTSRMTQAQIQHYRASGADPLTFVYRNQAMARFKAERMGMQQQAQNMMSNGNVGPGGVPMQPQRSNNAGSNMGAQLPTSMATNEFGQFISGVDAIMQPQDAGHMTGQGSASQSSNTPQHHAAMAGQANGQRPVSNPNMGAQQQQQLLNAQRAAQQDRMNQAAARETQARANASAQGKTMALHGQPGGGLGAMPPQQSPAMPTLNTPMRTPSQQQAQQAPNQGDPPGSTPENGPRFGPTLNPHFGQPNMRFGQNPAMNQALLQGMTPDQRARFNDLPPDKLNQVMMQWQDRAISQASAAEKPQMPGQVNPQQGRGMPQQAGMNPAQMVNMFDGRPLPPGMDNQQQMLYKQQVLQLQMANAAKARQQQQQAGQPMPQVPPQVPHHILPQMDGADIPPAFLGTMQTLSRPVPEQIKKWGDLKAWVVRTNGPQSQQMMEVNGRQAYHYQAIVRQRQLHNGRQAAMANAQNPNQPPQPQTNPNGMAAPVAPMGQVPMNNGLPANMPAMGLRQITPQDIQTARTTHPRCEKMNDNQIRDILINAQRANLHRQQQQRQQMMAMGINPQIPPQQGPPARARPGAQGLLAHPPISAGSPQVSGMVPVSAPGNQAPTQALGVETPVQKQLPASQHNVEAMAPSDSTGRASKPPAANRPNTLDTPSAQPPKSLKRPNSDDVVEIPNPNQKPNIPPQQPGASSQPPRRPTEEQLRQMTPEQRQRFQEAWRNSHAISHAMQRCKVVMQEERVKMANEPMPEIHMPAEARLTMANQCLSIHNEMAIATKALPKWYGSFPDDDRLRQFCRLVSSILPPYPDLS